ncbi:MAG: ABC transporter ATP-binding protein/permease [Schleiferiaceae bacterium]|nr:ABC transporter ATP-binding protein/permease [Schleiferiaceae bacterium]
MKSLSYLNKYLWKYKYHYGVGFVFVIIAVIFQIYPAQFVRESFNTVEEAIRLAKAGVADESDLKNVLIKYGVLIISFSLLEGLFTFFMRQTIIVGSRHIEYDLKNEVYAHYQKLDTAFFKRNKVGDLMNRISEDVSRVRMYLGPAIMYSMRTLTMLIILISIMFQVNPKLTLVTLLPLPFLSYAIYRVSFMINTRSSKVQAQLSKLSSFTQETFSGIRVLKAYNREKKSIADFTEQAELYNKKNKSLYTVNALFFPLMILLIGLSTILVLFVGGNQVIAGEITVGNVAEFIMYVNMLTWPIASIGWVTSIIQHAAASQARINEFLNTKPEIVNNTEAHTPIHGSVAFDNVSFVYPDSGTQALKDVSFFIPKGGSLAVVGKTGSGKSTIAALLTRMYDVDAGRILIDNKEITEQNLFDVRKAVGYVPQEGFMFSDTIANNIAFGLDLHAKERQVRIEQAAKDAHVHHNIMDFPRTWETRVGERGITLSGGQKQRIAIARAIIKNPELLIFDDCLSAVDTETEGIILNNLKRLMQNKTTLIISHRISSIKHCDEIIVLDKGVVIERGNHDTLLKANGFYAEMYQTQLLESVSEIIEK